MQKLSLYFNRLRPRPPPCKSTSVLSKELKKNTTEGTARVDEIIMNIQPQVKRIKQRNESLSESGVLHRVVFQDGDIKQHCGSTSCTF